MGRLKDKYTDAKYELTTYYGIESTAKSDRMVLCKSQAMLSLPRTKLSLTALKIFDIYLARINPEDPSITKVVFSKQELCDVLGVRKLNNEELKMTLASLMTCIVTIYVKGNKRQSKIILTGLLSKAEIVYDDPYYRDLATIELECTDSAKKYIYNVDAVGYLKMNLSRVLAFENRNPYSLYQYISQNSYRGHWEVDIDELKEYLGMCGKYRDIKDFEKWVLRPSKKEIEAKTDLRYEYKKIRVGRRIGKIAFQIIRINLPALEESKDVDMDDDLELPFSKLGEYNGLGRYRFDDDEYPFN